MPDPLSPPSASPLSLSRMRRYLGAVLFIRSRVCSNRGMARQTKHRPQSEPLKVGSWLLDVRCSTASLLLPHLKASPCLLFLFFFGLPAVLFAIPVSAVRSL